MKHHLEAKFWWILAGRGILGILLGVMGLIFILDAACSYPDVFGLGVFLGPFKIVAAILLTLGAYAFVDGIFAFTLGIQDYGKGSRWWSLILEGLISVGLGIATWSRPESAAVLVLLYWIGAWAIITGLLEISQALEQVDYPDRRGPFLTAGVVSVVFGFLVLAVRPGGAGLVVLMVAYAFAFSVPLLLLAARLRAYDRSSDRPQADPK